MNDDFTEEEEFNELPEGIEFAEPLPKKAQPPQRGRPRQDGTPIEQSRQQQSRQQQPRQQSIPPTEKSDGATEPAIIERYSPYIMPERVGIFDNEAKQPLMEDKDTITLLLGLVTKLLNDIDDVKKSL